MRGSRVEAASRELHATPSGQPVRDGTRVRFFLAHLKEDDHPGMAYHWHEVKYTSQVVYYAVHGRGNPGAAKLSRQDGHRLVVPRKGPVRFEKKTWCSGGWVEVATTSAQRAEMFRLILISDYFHPEGG